MVLKGKFMSLEKLLTVAEVAKILRVAPNTVYILASNKKIPSLKIGGAVRFSPQALNEYINQKN